MNRTSSDVYDREDYDEIEPKASINEIVRRVLDLVVASRWWILMSLLIVTLVGISIVMYLPDQYTSEALLVLGPQQISQQYVDPLMTMSNMDMVTALKHQVLSSAGLLRIIRSVGLYDPDMIQNAGLESLAARLREDIVIAFVGPGRDPNAFTISYTASRPQLAQEVTSRVTSMFIEENLKTRENQATTTTTFLAEQIEAARQKLAEQEQRLREFKTRNMGELPEQEQANVGALTNLRIQLQNTQANVSRARQQQRSAELMLDETMARVQSERTELLGRFTPKHPEIQKKDREIQNIGNLLASLSGGRPAVQNTQPVVDYDPAIAKLKSQVEDSIFELDTLSKEERRLRSEIAQYETRLRLTPVRQQELSGLFRDYDLYKQDYSNLLNKQLRAQLTASVEEQGASQQFRVVEPPTLPVSPSAPNRRMIGLGAAAAGLALGFALAFLKRMFDRSFHTEREIRQHFAIPVVIGVPSLYTPGEEHRQRRRRILEWVAASALLLVVVAAELYVYHHG